MNAFLEDVCDQILENYSNQTGQVCIVTPNRRAGLFFRRHFSQKVTRTIWAPEIYSIEDFVNHITGLQICDNISLMFEFYKVYKETEGENARSIDDFFRWAPVLLKDFDEIDAQRVDPSQLFGYITDLKRIEAWNPDGSPLTSFQKQYLDFFEKFEKYHSRLTKHLLEQQLAWQGLSFRLAAEKVSTDNVNLPWQKIIFAGFNALNSSEETIIKNLVKQNIAEIITDSDPYYLDNPVHEAGYFIRKYQRDNGWKVDKEKPSCFSGKPKEINVYGVAGNVNQTRLAGNLLREKNELTPDENTAVVLANENLLVPMLYSLPSNVDAVNVTMGYPLKKTNLFGFFNTLLQLYITNARLQKKDNEKSRIFYYKDIIRWFGHQATAFLWDTEDGQERISNMLRRLAQSNYSFCSFRQLAKLSDDPGSFSETFGFLDQPLEDDIPQLTETLLKICHDLDDKFRLKAQNMQMTISQSPWFVDYESLYYFSGIIRRLKSLSEKFQSIGSLKTFQMLFRSTVSQSRLSFSGEPIEGLQIMGMLETRSLDFKNIIILSANEDILPKGKSNLSFVPFDVKKKFGLQVHTDKDATYSYHFYRLLQRAENIHIVYNKKKSKIGNQEKSRFITQLLMELPEFNPEIKIKEHLVALTPPAKAAESKISIQKTDQIIQRLSSIASKGFSPSALGTFINCPLQFYLQKVARIDETEQVEETIESNTLGTIIHATLENLYKPFEGKVLDISFIDRLKPEVHDILLQQFKENFPGGNIDSGKNLLFVKVAARMINNFLEQEKDFLSANPTKVLTILQLEKNLESVIEVPLNGHSIQVKVKGLADRIDKIDNTVRIIDYKTGKVQPSHLTVNQPESIFQDPKMSKVFQLLCYSWLYDKHHNNGYLVESGIFSMRNLSQGLLTVRTGTKAGIEKETLINDFEEQLKTQISHILNPEIPFEQSEDEERCTYCNFKVLCNRINR